MFTDGKPRYWIPETDRWSLAAPVLLVLVLALLAVLPKPVVPKLSAVPPPRALAPTTILTPRAGEVFRLGAVGDLEGTAEPNGRVRLHYGTNLIGQTTATADGRYRFQLAGFPAGPHTLRVETVLDARNNWSSEVAFTVQPAPKPTAPKKPAPAKKRTR